MSEDGRPAAQNGALDIRIKDAVRGLDDGRIFGMLEQDELGFFSAQSPLFRMGELYPAVALFAGFV